LSRIRKSLFDILGDAIKGERFLDLYAGSGAVGIEALSRGASEAAFVEIDPVCVKIIKENLLKCGFLSRARIYQQDVLRVIPYLLEEENFSFIFVGPPYFKNLQDKTLDVIQKIGSFQGQIIIQYSPKEKVDLQREGMELLKQKRYGDTCLSFLFKKAKSAKI